MSEMALVDGEAAEPFRGGVADVWRQAFGPLDDEAEWTETIWDRHRAREGYRLAVATDRAQVLGFGWGYTGAPGQFWSDHVLRRLGPVAAPWIGGHFEFVELAVTTAARGRGLGRRLHDLLLAGLPHDRAVLGTSSDPADPAVRLYTARGWQHLGLLDPDTQVMVRRLDHSIPAAVSSS